MEYRIPMYKLKLIRERSMVSHAVCYDMVQVAALFFHRLIGGADREHAAALFLDVHFKPTGASILGIGSLVATPMPSREVYKAALLANAHKVIVAHNHPSGIAEPSTADIRVTRTLVQAGDILGITLYDHIIVCPDGSFVSMRESKWMTSANSMPTPDAISK